MFDEAVAGAAPPAPLKPPRVAHTLRLEGVKKWAPNQKISRKGAVRQAHGPERSRRAKPQRPAKKLKEFELAFLCALAPLREAVDFFTASLRHACASRGAPGGGTSLGRHPPLSPAFAPGPRF